MGHPERVASKASWGLKGQKAKLDSTAKRDKKESQVKAAAEVSVKIRLLMLTLHVPSGVILQLSNNPTGLECNRLRKQ